MKGGDFFLEVKNKRKNYGDGRIKIIRNHGKEKYVYIYFVNGKRETKFADCTPEGLKYLKSFQDEQIRKRLDGIRGSEKNLENAIINYLQTYKLNRVRSSTYTRYIDTLYNINPNLLSQQFDSIIKEDIQLAINDIEFNKSISEAHKVLKLLNMVFEDAVDNDIIRKNPCRKITITKYKPTEKIIFSGEELKRIFSAIRFIKHSTIYHSMTHDYGMLFTFLLYTGTRVNEALGSRFEDIIWDDEPRIHIQRTIDSHHRGGGQKTNAPKTASGDREVPLHPVLVRKLKRIYPKNGKGYIFRTASGKALSSNNLYRTWEAIQRATARECPHCHTKRSNSWDCPNPNCKHHNTRRALKCSKCGTPRPISWICPTCGTDVTEIHKTIHCFRHTFISYLMNKNTPISIVKYIAGHSPKSTVTTDVYTHIPADYHKQLQQIVKKNRD